MFIEFLYDLRRAKVPVGTTEAVALAEALARGLHENSLEGFYYIARAILVHREQHTAHRHSNNREREHEPTTEKPFLIHSGQSYVL